MIISRDFLFLRIPLLKLGESEKRATYPSLPTGAFCTFQMVYCFKSRITLGVLCISFFHQIWNFFLCVEFHNEWGQLMSHKKLQGYWWLPWLFINFTSGFSSLQYTIRGNQSYESLPHFETKENNNIPPLYFLFSPPHIRSKHKADREKLHLFCVWIIYEPHPFNNLERMGVVFCVQKSHRMTSKCWTPCIKTSFNK